MPTLFQIFGFLCLYILPLFVVFHRHIKRGRPRIVSFGEDTGGETSVTWIVVPSHRMFASVNVSISAFLGSYKYRHKKRGIVAAYSTHRGSSIAIVVEQTTLEPTPI